MKSFNSALELWKCLFSAYVLWVPLQEQITPSALAAEISPFPGDDQKVVSFF